MSCTACGRRTAEADRFCAGCGTPLAPASAASAAFPAPPPVVAEPRESRRKVSMLFLDVVGSTTLAERLDPEPLRRVMDRYFASCGACIAEHGGVVEKFIGDAILAAFGATAAREDDALRAVRAATGALAALAGLTADLAARYGVELEARAGICTGNVVVITRPGDDFRVVGDSVNTAARLQTAAAPGEVLICADTAAMVRAQVGIEPVEPLRLKGKSRPVPAWRVTAPDATADAPGPLTPFIGRTDELAALERGYRRARERREVCLATVLGAPGIGKSRLVREFLSGLPDGEALVLAGRCSAYGRGITYRPLAEMLGSLPGGRPELVRLLAEDAAQAGSPDRADGRTRRLVTRTLAAVADPALVDPAVADPALGDPADSADPADPADPPPGQVGVEDIAWAVRHLLAVLGRSRPVVMVWEDLHWAEATLLDLVDEIATWLRDVPVLLLCVARPELLDQRADWGGGKPCATTVDLGPMSEEQTAALVGGLVLRGDVHPQDLRIEEQRELAGRVVALCDGNPFFAEQLMDVFAETAPGTHVPPTVQALLGARLDRLPATERGLLELAAVVGREFSRGQLRAMAEADGVVPAAADEATARLARRRVFEPGPAATYRFAQALLRDTAYEFTPKTRRERWHGFLADRLSRARPGDPMAVAYHVEAGWQLRRQLRPGEHELPALAGAAAGTLIAEGTRALARKDLPAAVQLLERGRTLLPVGDPRHIPLALHVCDAGIWLQDEARCRAALDAAEAALPGNPRAAATLAVQRGIVALRLGLAPPAAVAADADRLTALLEHDPGDDRSWSRLHQLHAHLELAAERTASAESSFRLALARARVLADNYEEDRLLCAVCELAQWTPTPVAASLELCALLGRRFAANRSLLIPVLVARAHLEALAGDVAAARRTLTEALTCSHDVHTDLADAVVLDAAGFVESLAGAHEVAEARYRQSLGVLRAAEHAPDTRTTEVAIARELFAQGRTGAAAVALAALDPPDGPDGRPGEQSGERDRGRDNDQPDRGRDGGNPRARLGATALRARLASARGDHPEAVAAATAARRLSEDSDDPCLVGETLFDLAIVLRAAGRAERATAEGTEALRMFEAKGAALPAGRVRAWLAAGGTGAPGGAAPAPAVVSAAPVVPAHTVVPAPPDVPAPPKVPAPPDAPGTGGGARR
ncbi:adenylate/guanylate cyclase [Streptomyces sp. TLI_053]|uniref:adenylate/guanylate cyclase domain-containing protein n=1 Tax=Streptomyces sp. TLI_053 TaxID=1855352 RepID=UPI00087A669E|nr:adenylate/guanylate cyclase domain-containing protein [Streptomyces sp. TLI_053]SDT82034.1 adenylate/guanylate cyclase [Streptomyces sp. TLI_053]